MTKMMTSMSSLVVVILKLRYEFSYPRIIEDEMDDSVKLFALFVISLLVMLADEQLITKCPQERTLGSVGESVLMDRSLATLTST